MFHHFLGGELVQCQLLMHQVFVGIIIRLEYIHTLIDETHKFFHYLFIVGKGGDGELVDAFDGRRRNRQCLDIELTAREDGRYLVEHTHRVLRENGDGVLCFVVHMISN